MSFIGNEGFAKIMNSMAEQAKCTKMFFAVEFHRDKFYETATDAKIAAAWDGNGRYVKMPAMMKRTAYRVDLDTKETDWTLILFNRSIYNNPDSDVMFYEEFPRRYCTREEATGPYGPWFKYRLTFA